VIAVVRPGLLTTVQDLGRTGYAHLGVARSGALDPTALVRGNRLVGNPDGTAGLEATLTGVALRAETPTTVAVTGAPAQVTVDGRAAEFGVALDLEPGSVLDVGAARVGVRSYLTFAGGITVVPVLGSRSTDTLSGLGPPPLRAGFVLPLGKASTATSGGPWRQDPLHPDLAPPPASALDLRLRLGPRHDWISQTARDALLQAEFTLSVKSNRVGARLAGPTLTRAVAGELPSEGIVLGAVQVPADGQPLIFLADHPTTGGYPVVGVVDNADLPLVAQARPGTAVRFVPWS
jgi:biotin-dependent carboxylase-like uncharacterized protein